MNDKRRGMRGLRLVLAAVAVSWWTWPGAIVAAETTTLVIRVDVDNTTLNPDGLSWETAFTDIQDGVDATSAAGKSGSRRERTEAFRSP